MDKTALISTDGVDNQGYKPCFGSCYQVISFRVIKGLRFVLSGAKDRGIRGQSLCYQGLNIVLSRAKKPFFLLKINKLQICNVYNHSNT